MWRRPFWKHKKRLLQKNKKVLRRLLFFSLDVAIIGAVLTTLTPRLSRADTVTASESFSNTNNINTGSSTAKIDTNHTQARLTNTDSWSVAAGAVSSSTTFNDVGMASTSVGWAITSGGAIYKTTDGGLTWFPQTSGVSVSLNAVSVVDTSNAYVVGASGTILKTTNGGTTWSSQTSGTSNALNGVVATSATAAWAVGASGTIIATSNGSSWSAETSGTSNALNSIAAVSSSVLWAVGNTATIVATTNGGTSWSTQTASGSANFLKVATQDANTAILVGAGGVIFITLNGGTTWNSAISPTSNDLVALDREGGTNTFVIADTASGVWQRTNLSSGSFTQLGSTQNGVSLNGIAMPSSTAGVIVGASGVILQTTDGLVFKPVNGNGEYTIRAIAIDPSAGSEGWIAGDTGGSTSQFFNTLIQGETNSSTLWLDNGTATGPIRAIAVRNNFTLDAVGSSGTAISVAQSSGTVTTHSSGTSVQLNGIASDGVTKQWAVGNSGTIRVTTDSGSTWSGITSGTSANLNAATSDGSSSAYIVGDSGTFLTASTSSVTTGSTGVSTNLNAISRSSSTLWAAGSSNTIIRSSNSGSSWSSLTSGLASSSNFLGIAATSSSTAYAITSTTIIKTSDSGATWTNIAPNDLTEDMAFTSIAATSSKVLVAGSYNLVLASTDSGSTWSVSSGSANSWLRASSCTDSSTCWVAGHNGDVLSTTNGGSTWSTTTASANKRLLGIKMASASVGWAVGDNAGTNGASFASTVLKTTNGGSSWSAQTSGVSVTLRAVDAASTSVAWAVGSSGTIINTTNGGTAWSSQTSGVSTQLNAVSAPSTTVAWIGGASGTVLLTTDGSTWTSKTTGVSVNLNGIAGIDSSTGYVVGDSGTILKTTNGGSTWSTLTSGTSANLQSVAALDTNTIRVTGVGVTLQSTDAGSTWSSIATSTIPSSLTAYSITHPAINTGIIAGQSGTIVRYVPVYSSSSEIAVSQNVNSSSANIGSATLTATATLNSQTITYALSNDGGTTFNTVTSGTVYTFTTTGADLRWRATLSTSDTTTTPVLTAISISADTTGSTGRSTPPNNNPPDQGDCTKTGSCAPKAPLPNPTAKTPTILSATSIRWNFSDSDSTGVKLLLRTSDGKYAEIARVENKSVASIDETGLQANANITNHYVQNIGSKDLPASPIPTELPSVTLPPVPPPAPELADTNDQSVKLKIAPGSNAEPIVFALQEGVSKLWLGDGRSFTQDSPVWKKLADWTDTPDGMTQIVGLKPNTAYAFRVKARGIDNTETDFSPSAGLVTNIEQPATIVPVDRKDTAVQVQVKSVNDDGSFSNLNLGSSGILIENTTTGTSSGWIQGADWTLTDLKPGTTYQLRVRTRRNDGVESPVSPTIVIATTGTNEDEQKKVAEEKKLAEQKKAEELKAQQEKQAAEQRARDAQQQQDASAQNQTAKDQTAQDVLPPASQSTPAPSGANASAPETQNQTAPSSSSAPAAEFGGAAAATPTFGAGGALTRHLTPRVADINGTPVDPTHAMPHVAIDPTQAPELVVRGQSEPDVLVSVIIESEPFIATTNSDHSGAWIIRIASALIPDAPEHTVSVQAGSGDTASPKVAIATLSVSKPVLTRLNDTVVHAAGAIAEQTLKVVEQTTQKTLETTKNVARATAVIAKRVEPQAQVTLTTVVPIVVAFNPPLWALIPQLPVLFTNLLTWLLTLLGIRKRRLPWGVIYDAVSKQPLALAIVRIVDANTKRIIETQVTDRRGRFGVMLAGGSYRIEVTKGAYRFPSHVVNGPEDGMFVNVYRGGEARVPSDGSVLPISIPLDPEAEERISSKQRATRLLYEIRRAFKAVSPFLLWGGTASGFILAFASPTPFNMTVGGLYLALAVIDQLGRPRLIRSWGRVVDANSGDPIPLAAVDLIDLKYNKLVKSQLTDRAGRFAFLPPPGQYKVQARKEHYEMVVKPKPIRGVHGLYGGVPITVTEKAPTITVTLALERTKG